MGKRKLFNLHSNSQIMFTGEYQNSSFFRFLIPLIVSEVFQQLYSLVNSIVVNRVLNYQALAVIGACSGILSIMRKAVSGYVYGFGIYLGRAVGKNDEHDLHETFTASLYSTFILSGIIIFLCFLIPWFSQFAGIPEVLQNDSTKYLLISMISLSIIGLKLLFLVTLQAFGDTGFTGFAAAIGVVINTLFVILFIGVFKRSVAFSAAASLLANLIVMLLLAFRLFQKKKNMILDFRQSLIRKNTWVELWKNGTSKGAYFLLGGLGDYFLQLGINTLPITVIAGHQLGIQMQIILLAPLGELGTASGVITGQNIGAKNYSNIHLYHKKLRNLLMLFGLIAILLIYISGQQLLTLLFGSNAEAEVIHTSMLWLKTTVLIYPLSFTILYRNALQAAGYYRQVVYLGVISTLGNAFITFILMPRLGYTAVWCGTMLIWLLQSIVGCLYFSRIDQMGENDEIR